MGCRFFDIAQLKNTVEHKKALQFDNLTMPVIYYLRNVFNICPDYKI